MQYIYRLSGKAEELAKAQVYHIDQINRLRNEYLDRNGLDHHVSVSGSAFGESLAAVKIPDSGIIPDGFKRCKRISDYMEPNSRTKSGKEILKEWESLRITREFDSPLIRHLGVSEMHFVDGGFTVPKSLTMSNGSFFLSAQSVNHSEAEEITAGDLDKSIEEHNAGCNK